MIIQELIFPYIGDTELYFRIDNGKIENKEVFLEKNGTLKTNTFFNIFSAGKWFKYTDLNNLSIHFAGTGKVKLEIFKIHNDNETEQIVYSEYLDLNENIIIELPANIWQFNNGMIFFALTAYENAVIEKANYITNTLPGNDIFIALNICTYRREEYLKNNITKLEKDILNNPNSFLYNKLEVFIADNGKTLGNSISTDKIHVFPNANTGGSGGFTRGLQEILTVSDEKKITHTIFMDDDIKLIPQVIERTAQFLSFIKNEFADSIIPGAMLKSDSPEIQHEFGGCWTDKVVLLHSGLDTIKVKTLTQNDKESSLINFAGWWYCCFQLEALKKIGLPLPLFIKGDDVEFSLRLKTNLILLNGIGVWHESFENKYHAVNIYYESRNQLIVNSIHKIKYSLFSDFFNNIFWRLVTYRYAEIPMYLQAIRDFCKGPKWLINHNAKLLNKQLRENTSKYGNDFFINILSLPNDFEILNENDIKEHTYSKLKTLLTLNGYLLPANKNIVLPIGADAHEMYRVKNVIWYNYKVKKGVRCKKSFPMLFACLIKSFYTCIIIMLKYKQSIKKYYKYRNYLFNRTF